MDHAGRRRLLFWGNLGCFLSLLVLGALLGRPALVIADEPTSALDASLRDAFMALLLEACRDGGSTLVFVSHDDRLADRFDRCIALPVVNRAARPVTA